VTGTASGPANQCQNGTGVTMTYVTDETLDGQYRQGTSTSSPTSNALGSAPATASTTSTSSSTSPNLALKIGLGVGLSLGVLVLIIGAIGFVLWRRRHSKVLPSGSHPSTHSNVFEKAELPAGPVLTEREMASNPKMPLERHMLDSNTVRYPVELEGSSRSAPAAELL
jgi:hypothetical protein